MGQVNKIKESKGKERKGKERKGKERKGKERKGKERKGKERKGKGKASIENRKIFIPSSFSLFFAPYQFFTLSFLLTFAFADLEFTPQREAVRQVHRGVVKISLPKLAISGKLSVPSPLPDKKG
jgi:hypothetical protein